MLKYAESFYKLETQNKYIRILCVFHSLVYWTDLPLTVKF